MFGTQSEEGSGVGSEEEFSSAVLGSEEGAVAVPEPEAEEGVEALPEWADDVLELVAQGARLIAAQDQAVCWCSFAGTLPPRCGFSSQRAFCVFCGWCSLVSFLRDHDEVLRVKPRCWWSL